MWYRVRARTASILDVPEHGDTVSKYFDLFLIALIVVNVVAIILESVSVLQQRWASAFFFIEITSLAIFSLEYVFRVWSIVDNKWRPEYAHPLWGRLRFMRSPMAIVDLLAVAPFWLGMFIPMDLRFLRVVRLLRVLKLTRYSAAMNLLFEVLRAEGRVIGAAMFTLFLTLIFAASAIYLVENEGQPEDFANIPQAMWWAIVTVTTVGYGDVVPITPVGKVLGAFLGLIGVGMVALPAGILASGFSEVLNRHRSSLRREYTEAMQDGFIDADERTKLKKRGASLNLSDEEIDEMLAREASESCAAVCPHCGKPLPGEDPPRSV